MKLLYGTANPAKLKHMCETLKGLPIEIIGLNDLDLTVEPIDESGNNPLENAKIKAKAYYKAAQMPVFSCDSGLYIKGLDSEDQPGVHVRRVNGKTLNDEEMIEHYTRLALKLGGKARVKYKNAICLILDENTIFEYDGEDISSVEFMIARKAHTKRNPGFPLDSISIHIETGQYYMDMASDSRSSQDDKLAGGFSGFFNKLAVDQKWV